MTENQNPQPNPANNSSPPSSLAGRMTENQNPQPNPANNSSPPSSLAGRMTENQNPQPNPANNSSPPSSLALRGLGGGVPWLSSPQLWEKLKPLARQMRREPTPAEKLLWLKLRQKQLLGFKFRRQQAIDRFIVDFYCAEAGLVVEVDGEIHDYTQQEDRIRQEFLEGLGLRVLRFRNEDVLQGIEGVLEGIAAELQR